MWGNHQVILQLNEGTHWFWWAHIDMHVTTANQAPWSMKDSEISRQERHCAVDVCQNDLTTEIIQKDCQATLKDTEMICVNLPLSESGVYLSFPDFHGY